MKSEDVTAMLSFEADIEDGKIKHAELAMLPESAHVLITLLSPVSLPERRKPDWAAIKRQIGKLQLRQDSVQWQRALRSEWR